MAIHLYAKAKQEATFWLGRRLPRCDDLLTTMSESLERKLTFRENVRLRLHFLICEYCHRYLRHIRLMHRAVGDRAAMIDDETSTSVLSREARERLKRALTEKS